CIEHQQMNPLSMPIVPAARNNRLREEKPEVMLCASAPPGPPLYGGSRTKRDEKHRDTKTQRHKGAHPTLYCAPLCLCVFVSLCFSFPSLSFVRSLQPRYVQFLHLKQRFHDSFRFLWVFVLHQLT